ncbi:IS630 family transposase [Halomonas jincaotanensis]|uniref:IS630 family transposase n=1 Tax=Halomonas jincaotanensis TaxID=2810616 RepID=UPI0038734EA1
MKFRFVATLSDTDLQVLMEAYQQGEKPAFRRRAHAIVLSHKGHTIDQISDILGATRETVANWLSAWEAHGIEGLNDKPRTGRPPIYDEADHEQLKALVDAYPHQIRTVQAHFQQATGKKASLATIKRWLKKMGYSFKRARRSLKHRRDETDFRNTQGLLSALQQWEETGGTELYYFDESGFSQSSAVPYAWSPVGQPLAMSAYSRSQRLNVLGFPSRQGKLVYHATTETVTTSVVVDAFDQFMEHKSPDTFAIVVVDNASVHRSALFQRKRLEWLNQRVHVVYLSPYSPELNLIEILWRKVKYEWLPVTAYESFQALQYQVREILSGYGKENRITFA